MRSLVVGRFQPLHLGHLKMMEYAAEKTNFLIIGLGSCNKCGDWEHPFTAEEREEMIKESLQVGTPFEIKRIPDFGDNQKWITWVKENISFDVFITNSENEKKIFEEAGYKTQPVPYYERELYSATEVRKRILADEDWGELLPVGTIKVMNKIDGIHRIKELEKK